MRKGAVGQYRRQSDRAEQSSLGLARARRLEASSNGGST